VDSQGAGREEGVEVAVAGNQEAAERMMFRGKKEKMQGTGIEPWRGAAAAAWGW